MLTEVKKEKKEDDILDSIADNLMLVFPIIHKVLLKVDPPDLSTEFRLSRLHIGILASIQYHKMSSSEIAKKFIIPKPQMTHLINLMGNANMIEKKTNKQDKRVTDLSLTPKGLKILKQCDEFYKSNVKEKLSSLNKEDIEALSVSLINLIKIGNMLVPR